MLHSTYATDRLVSQGSLSIFWSNWLVGGIMTLGLVMLFWPLIGWLKDRIIGPPRSQPAA